MLCLKTFTEKNTADFPTWDEWVAFVNSNRIHGRNVSTLTDYEGKCEISDLPSFHPYWHEQIRQSKLGELEALRGKVEECRANPKKVKILFNKSATLEHLEKMLADLEKELAPRHETTTNQNKQPGILPA